MKKRTKKNNNLHNESQKPLTLIANSYKKKTNPIIVILFKMLCAYLITFSTLMCFVDFYGIPYSFSTALQQVILFVTAFFPLLVFFKKRYVIPALIAVTSGLYCLFYESINKALIFMKDLLMIRINSRLLGTLQYVESSSLAFHENTQNFISELNEAMMILVGIISLICVLCIYKKFRLIALSLMWTALYSFAVAAERADFTIFVLILIASVTGLFAMSASNEMFSKSGIEADKHRSKSRSPIEKAFKSVSDHGKNYITGGIVTTVTLICAFIINSFFPNYSYIDTQEIVDATVKIASNIGNIFSFQGDNPLNSTGIFNGYFSSDSFNISNEILLDAPPIEEGDTVLKITSDEKSGAQYLIGDIGVNFNGTSWDSIMKYCDADNYTAGDEKIVSDAFSNEEIFQIFASFAYSEDFDNSELKEYAKRIVRYSNLNIEYLKKTDIVFKPYMPYALDYLSNDKFTFYGDSILRISDSSNWIKGFISSTIAPCNYNDIAIIFSYAEHITADSAVIRRAMSAMGYSSEYITSYLNDKAKYDEYVKNTYMSVPESEKDNIRKLLSEYRQSEFYRSAYSGSFASAYQLSIYLQNKYIYSLTTDNSPNEKNTALGRFLFENKSGHCAMYASAMTLALREYGIPARYITGFAASKCEYDAQTQKYIYEVKENNLHAWVEAYFPSLGWIAFDPTSPYVMNNTTTIPGAPAQTTDTTAAVTTAPITSVSQTSAAAEQTTSISEETTTSSDNSKPNVPDINDKNNDNFILIRIIIISLLIIGIAVGVSVITIKIIKDKHERRKVRFRKSEAGDAVREMYKFVMKLYAAASIIPAACELPMDFAKRADEETNAIGGKHELVSVMPIFEKSEFSESVITEEERYKAIEFTKSLYEHLLDCSGKIKRIYLKLTL